MPGIYFHIPFCKQACTYCDFHFSTSLKATPLLVVGLRKELLSRLVELRGRSIRSIYFGGGTPSLLPAEDIRALIGSIQDNATVSADVEITLEANPDDISQEKLSEWMDAGIDRISMGVQSFDDAQLAFMGRAHNASEARNSLSILKHAGLRSWSMDLIYGLPALSEDAWSNALEQTFSYSPPHLSAYCLTVEPRTKLHHLVQKGEVEPADNDLQASQFEMLSQRATQAGLVHYEISNFGREGHFSIHNTNYWKGEEYLGIGPSAHSFIGGIRRWNVANNAQYIRALENGHIYYEEEELSARQRTNEQLMTGLRTNWGVEISQLAVPLDQEQRRTIDHYVQRGLLNATKERLILTTAGWLLADRIASDLFQTDEGNDRT